MGGTPHIDIEARAARPTQLIHDLEIYAKALVAGWDANILTAFPVEIVERVLAFCHPWDVASFAQTCRLAHSVVYHPTDQYLWRELFLFHPFDDPRCSLKILQGSNSVPLDWRRELTRRMKAVRLISSAHASAHEKACALGVLISVVQKTPPVIQDDRGDAVKSYDLVWLNRLLRRSRILDIQTNADTNPLHALLYSQLRSYAALTLDDKKDEKTQDRLKERRNTSRRFVYDLRNYTSDNSWGPYLNKGGVNWIHIECLINVILMNISDLPAPWAHMRPPLGLEATRPYSAPGTCASSRDWAGVEGKSRAHTPHLIFLVSNG
jgi:hypothetical protein